MRYGIVFVLSLWVLAGCSATWEGVKEDSDDAYKWSKKKVNEGATYIKEKTD